MLVVHEWWGNNDYSRRRARDLAELGYVAFAMDMYGKGKFTNDPKQAAEWSAVRSNATIAPARQQAAYDLLKGQPNVDPGHIAAIGYCFGGTVVINMARAGMDLDGVVSFHGSFPPATSDENHRIKARILICNGGIDTFSTKEQIDAFSRQLKDAGVNFRIVNYPGAAHSFTNPSADKFGIDGVEYNAEADRKSWEDRKQFLRTLFDG